MKKMTVDNKKQKILDNICGKIQKAYGKDSITYLGNNKIVAIPKLPTQSLALDYAIGGGWPEGRIIEIFGPESSSKSTLCYHAIAEAQQTYPDMPVALIDVENSFDPVYGNNLGINVGELLVAQPDTGTDALNILLDLINLGVRLIIVDSVAALVPKDEYDSGIEDQQMGSQARMMSKAMRKITGAIGKHNTIVIFTNQIREKIGVMFGEKTTSSGGRALKFYASIRVKTARIGNEKEGDDVVASKFKAQIVKNKVAPPFRSAEYIIRFGEGVDNLETLMDMAINNNIVEKKGSWFSYKGKQLGQGKTSLKNALLEDAGFLNEIETTVKKILEGETVEVENQPENINTENNEKAGSDIKKAIKAISDKSEVDEVEVGEV